MKKKLLKMHVEQSIYLSRKNKSRLQEIGVKELIQRCIENEEKQRALSNFNG